MKEPLPKSKPDYIVTSPTPLPQRRVSELPPPGPENMINRGEMPTFSPLALTILSIVVLVLMAWAWLQ